MSILSSLSEKQLLSRIKQRTKKLCCEALTKHHSCKDYEKLVDEVAERMAKQFLKRFTFGVTFVATPSKNETSTAGERIHA